MNTEQLWEALSALGTQIRWDEEVHGWAVTVTPTHSVIVVASNSGLTLRIYVSEGLTMTFGVGRWPAGEAMRSARKMLLAFWGETEVDG